MMRLNGKRIVPLVAVMFVLTQCCCCIGIPMARRAPTAAIYQLPAALVNYVSDNVQELAQELR